MPTRLEERFVRYARVDTTAAPDAGRYPSSVGQFELGRILVDELRALGAADVEQDEHGLVWATLPGNTAQPIETIAFCAHLDTSPETTGKNVKPVVWRNYDGSDLTLPGDPRQALRVSANPELKKCIGRTIITDTTIRLPQSVAGWMRPRVFQSHTNSGSRNRIGRNMPITGCGKGIRPIDG